MTERAYEINFDGIVGPTHNYAGLSYGNIASQKHKLSASNPRQAALQGLAKMKFLVDLGLKQAVLPPQERPDFSMLRRLGFGGSEGQIIEAAYKNDPRLLAAVYSASSMWAANAATISPSADSADGRVHFTPANLLTQLHRSIEPPHTARMLKAIFADESAFAQHDPLPAAAALADEGAANHMRLSEEYGSPGIQMFVYGRGNDAAGPLRYPARQTLEACAAIARLHQLSSDTTVFARQSPEAVDAGVFHNDVVAVANRSVMLYHASAYADSAQVVEELGRKFARISSRPLYLLEISPEQLPLADAVSTYLFNSQLVSLSENQMALIAPVECREDESARRVIESLIAADNPIRAVHYLDVRQSMQNGGGPACLRLRVVLTERELRLVHQGVFLSDALYEQLTAWVLRHYRDSLHSQDLADPKLARESRDALDELLRILKLDSIAG